MRAGFRLTALAVLGYAAVAYWIFRPTPSLLAHTIPAFHGISGDALFHTWGMNHVSRTILVDPLHLFDAGIFYPARRTLAYGDHMIGEGLLGLPIWLATHNPLLQFNLLTLGSFALCAAAAFRYRRETGGGLAGAIAAGLVFSFTPFRLNSPFWPQVLLTFAMPLALAAWVRWVRDGRRGDLVVWIAWWVVHSLMGSYVMFYFAVVMGVLACAAVVWAPVPDRARLLRGTILAPLATGLLLFPTLWPYVVLRQTQGHVRTMGFGTEWTFLLPGIGTWSGTLAGFRGRIGQTIASFGPGFFTSALALAGIWTARRQAHDAWARFLWRTNLLGLAVSLLIMFVPIELQLRLPGFDMMRMTNRAFHVGLIFAAWMAGAAADALVALGPSRRSRVAVATLLTILLVLDAGSAPADRRRMPLAGDLPPIYAAVRDMPEPVLYERTDELEGAAEALYFSIFHGKKLVNGYSGFTSPGPAFANQRLFEFPSAPARALLGELGVHAVLLREASPAALDRRLAALPGTGVRVIARDGAAALLHVDTPPEMPLPPATPLPRTGRTIAASDGSLPLTIDLGAVRPVAGVRSTTGSDAAGIYGAEVATSVDGVEWTPTDARFSPDSLATLFARPADVRFWEARFPARPARWIRLTNPRLSFWGGTWQPGEIDVLAPAS